jgi:broad specificity phosphatase PhoE
MADGMTTLLLVRHGQARAADGSYGPDTPLSELGVSQAEAVG